MGRPKKKPQLKAIIIKVSFPARQRKILSEIENKSKFFQLALDDAAGIMAWALLKQQQSIEPDKLNPVTIAKFNAAYPQTELTKQRLDKNNGSRTI